MKFVYQLGVILLISFAGEILNALIPLPIPASIYGLLLMLLCLKLRIVKLEHVIGAGTFLLEIMPFLFVPAVVGLISVWGDISRLLLPVIIIIPLTTVLVMVSTGRVTQFVLRKGKREM